MTELLSFLAGGIGGDSVFYLALSAMSICGVVYWLIQNAVLASRLNLRINTILFFEKKPGFWMQLWLLIRPVARILASGKDRDQLTLRLRQAGFIESQSVDMYILARFMVMIVAWLAGVFVLISPENFRDWVTPVAVLKQMAAAILGVRLSEWWLQDRVKGRIAKIRERTPQALELLTICITSGLTLEKGLHRVAAEIRESVPELSFELSRLSSELMVNENRIAVLERFGERCGIKELEMMATNLIQSVRYGTPVVESLKTLCVQSRLLQIDEIKEKASSIPAKISLPLIIFILFPLVVLLVAPPLIALGRTIFG